LLEGTSLVAERGGEEWGELRDGGEKEVLGNGGGVRQC